MFYVGELCRYLVNAPDVPNEKNHSVRLFFGNGMRPEVWRELLRRFGNVRVIEFYGSTEGNAVLMNATGEKVGSVGHPPALAPTCEVVEYDGENDRFIRDDGGRLIPCAVDAPGMLISRITSLNPFSRFDGYTDREASDRKVIRGAFGEDDAWFVSGDILRCDEDGDFWFVDRIGDTFRWKGENISTEQVATVIGRLPFVELCAVYGVELPGHEGRAGMAAVQLRAGEKFDGAMFYRAVNGELMAGGRPRFVRVVKALEMTDSMKVIKHHLQREGIDRTQVKGALYWYDEEKETYTRLSARNLDKAMAAL